MQQRATANGERFAAARDDSAVGQRIDVAPMHALDASAKTLGVQHLVHRGSVRPCRKPSCLAPCLGEGFRILAAALEARPMPGRQRRHLIDKKQLGVVAAPHVALPALEIEHAANPLPRRPAPPGQRFCVGMKAAAAVAEQRAARGSRKQFAERVHPVLQRHRQTLSIVRRAPRFARTATRFPNRPHLLAAGRLDIVFAQREDGLGKKIAFVGAGAVGGYTGAHMVAAGEDVTFIDPWPAHVEHMRAHGLRVTHAMTEPEFTVPVRALHVTDAQQLAKEQPVDIAFVCMKSYDTAWAAMLISQYLAPDGYVVSLQNCINEPTIAGVVGWGKTLGCIASSITVNLPEPGLIHRGAAKHGAAHTVFRAGEVHGRVTPRAEEVCRLVAFADSAKVTSNLWGERWSKLVANAMQNGLSACTGLPGGEMLKNDPIRRFSTRLGSEAIRVGQALGYELEEILHLPPETIARAGEGDDAANQTCDAQRFKDAARTAAGQRPSMGQDMQKGRRTEIEFLNGLIVREGEKLGLSCRANAVLTDLVKRVEKGDLKPDPRHITELRLN